MSAHHTPPEDTASDQSAIAVISAYGAFRLLLAMLAIWTFFEGFALFTGGLDALSFGGDDRTAERLIGAQLIVLAPIYGMLAWQRERYRLLLWIPYAAQIAIILPTLWGLFTGDSDGVLMLVTALVFFVMLFYFWWHSHPVGFFAEEEEYDEDEEYEDEDEDEEEPLEGDEPAASRPTKPASKRDARRAGRFRRRDG